MAFSKQRPYFNPMTPFVGCIQGGLQEGKTITVTGRVMPAAERFHVNLQCGSSKEADIAFHFNPRFTRLTGCVVCNTLNGGRWGREERKRETPIPLGSNFTLVFMVNRDSYSVIINGIHFLEYVHRLPIGQVNVIAVDGGVELTSIAFEDPPISDQKCHQKPHSGRRNRHGHYRQKAVLKSSAPGVFMARPVFTPICYLPQDCTPKCSFVVPYKGIITGGMHPGRSITIQGVANPNAVRFDINLRFNHGVAFHFNPRFNEGKVVRNSFLKEQWGSEERSGGMPFYPGQPFKVTITSDSECYKVCVNGAQMFVYQHRYHTLNEIDILEVNGDLSLTSVVF